MQRGGGGEGGKGRGGEGRGGEGRGGEGRGGEGGEREWYDRKGENHKSSIKLSPVLLPHNLNKQATVKPLLRDTLEIRTPLYQGHFAMSL